MKVTKPTYAKGLVTFIVNELSTSYRNEGQWMQDKDDYPNDLA